MTKKNIWDLYLYSESEVENNLYLSSIYFFFIKKQEDKIINSTSKLSKFALISLFPLYRSCNHMGASFSSRDYEHYENLDKKRLKLIKQIIGREIEDTEHYLNLLGVQKWFWLLPLPLSLKFYILVMTS